MAKKLVLIFLIFAVVVFAAGSALAADAAFVVEAVEIIENNYVDPVDRCALFNAAIDGLKKNLEEAELPNALDRISENDCPQAQDRFVFEFTRAVKAADGSDLDKTELAFTAAREVAKSLNDSHVYFLTPERYQEREEMITGKTHYAGIGITLHKADEAIYIVEVFDEAPAGGLLLPFDRIVSVNGREISAQMTTADVVDLIRGEEGAGLAVTVTRYGIPESLGFTLKRASVKPPVVSARMLGNGVGYLKIHTFERSGLSEEVNSKIKKLSDEGMKALVLDIRGNYGGLLGELVYVAGAFFPKKTVLCQEKDNKTEKAVLVDRHFFQPYLSGEDTPVVLLINGGSASSSEILAAAMQEHKRAVLVGEKTAVAVDEAILVKLPEDAGLVITIRRILTPKGVLLNQVGVTPDVIVPANDQDYALARDGQLSRALEIVKSKMK